MGYSVGRRGGCVAVLEVSIQHPAMGYSGALRRNFGDALKLRSRSRKSWSYASSRYRVCPERAALETGYPKRSSDFSL
jgi:hypothetical protein